MLRTTLFAILAASPAFAQNASTYLPSLAQALTGAGLTQLASLAQNVSGTTVGQQLLADLPNGNHTVFAPNNNAFNGNPPKNITDQNQLAAILSYHVISGSFSTANISNAPAHTILRTHLNDSQFVTLEGNKGQVLAVNNDNGTVRILGQNTQVQVVSTTQFDNLIIHVTNAVIDIPPPLSDVVTSSNLSMLATAAQQSGLLESLTSAHGITIFAPSNAAFNTALQALGGPANINQSTLHNVLGNHIINGTSVYSTELASANYTSAAGEPFKIATNSSGTFVSSGSSTAKVVEADILTTNGVVHVIDGVLLNTQNNTAAASSALASATSVAAQTATDNGAVGATSTSTGTSSSGNGGKKNGASALDLPVRQLLLALGLTFTGAVFIL